MPLGNFNLYLLITSKHAALILISYFAYWLHFLLIEEFVLFAKLSFWSSSDAFVFSDSLESCLVEVILRLLYGLLSIGDSKINLNIYVIIKI